MKELKTTNTYESGQLGYAEEEPNETENHRSRVRGDFQARFCEGQWGKFPLPTRCVPRSHGGDMLM